MKLNEKYWSDLYKKNQTGWDIGYISPPIKEYIDQLTDKSIKILIPGAGKAYEIEYLHNKGFTNCFLLDFSEEPINEFISRVPSFPKDHILKEDFFTHKGNYDLIIEHTFFSSIKPSLREKYVETVYRLLNKKGKLIGLLFKICFTNNYPPFGGNKKIYTELFSKYFSIYTLEVSYNSIKPRNGNELFIKIIK